MKRKQIQRLVQDLAHRNVVLTRAIKNTLAELAAKLRYISNVTQLVWGVDDLEFSGIGAQWNPEEGYCAARMVVVASEGLPLILGMAATSSKPTAYDYARSLWAGILDLQQLTGLRGLKPTMVICDRCGIEKHQGFNLLLDEAEIILRPAKRARPYAKPGVERAVHSTQARLTWNREGVVMKPGDDGRFQVGMPACQLFESAKQGVREFNHEIVSGKQTRASLYHGAFLNYGFELSEHQIAGLPRTFKDEASIRDNVVYTNHGERFKINSQHVVEDGPCIVYRPLFPPFNSLSVIAADAVYEALLQGEERRMT